METWHCAAVAFKVIPIYSGMQNVNHILSDVHNLTHNKRLCNNQRVNKSGHDG